MRMWSAVERLVAELSKLEKMVESRGAVGEGVEVVVVASGRAGGVEVAVGDGGSVATSASIAGDGGCAPSVS